MSNTDKTRSGAVAVLVGLFRLLVFVLRSMTLLSIFHIHFVSLNATNRLFNGILVTTMFDVKISFQRVKGIREAMNNLRNLVIFGAMLVGVCSLVMGDDSQPVKESVIDGPQQIKLKVRMEGPYTAEVPLQVVCYFKYTAERAKRMSGAPVELDQRLGGIIASLRERGEFVGEPLETILIYPPEKTIQPKALLIIGLGEEEALSLKLMESVGRVAIREAARLNVNRIAFAPLIRDQGNSTLATGDVAYAVVRGVLSAYATEQRLHQKNYSKPFVLEQWTMEAGPAYFEETISNVKKAVLMSGDAASK